MFLLFLIIDLYFLFPAVIAHIFNPITELIILMRMPTKEAKAAIEIHPVTVEAEIRKCWI